MVKVLDSDKTTADKAPLIYICPVCGKKHKQQICYSKHVSQCEFKFGFPGFVLSGISRGKAKNPEIARFFQKKYAIPAISLFFFWNILSSL